MGQYNYMLNNDMEPYMPDTDGNSAKIISSSFFAVFILAAVVLAVQFAIQGLVALIKPDIAERDWYVWLLTFLSLVGVGFPIYYLFMKRIPDSPKKEINKLPPSDFIMFFFICAGAMYITNLLTQIITFVISLIKGSEVVNPAADALMNGNYIISFIYAVIIAPIIEELIFRKLMLNKLRRFGDLPAILMTGLAFGIFHFNLQQFFYAAVLGFLFAYITIRSNTIIYSVLLHMMINFIGTISVLFVLYKNIIALMFLSMWVFTAISLGIAFFAVNFKKIRFEQAAVPIRVKTAILNPGVILFALLSIVVFVINTLAR